MIKLKVTKCNDPSYLNIIVYCNRNEAREQSEHLVLIDKVVKISSIT